MEEAKNEYQIKFGPYEVELKGNQVYFRKNNSLMKAMPVKSTFGLYDLKKLVQQVAKKVNMTSKLPKDVLKANKNEALGGFLGMEDEEQDNKLLKDKTMEDEKVKEVRALIRSMVSEIMDESDAGTVVAGEEDKIEEISTKAGLNDVIKGRTTSIEGIKFSKELAENLLYWIQTSPYGRKYGKHILKGRIASLIGPANAMGFGDRLKGTLKGEWKTIVQKHGPKREDVVEQLKTLKEGELNEINERDLLKIAVKGAFQARIGNTAAKAYLKSLQNSWRINKDWKEYKDWKVDDFEEDAINYVHDKR